MYLLYTELIEKDQTGFLRGRQTHNIRTLHTVEQARKGKKSTVLVSIDAEKAFNCVKWKFLYKVLEQFGFSKKAIQCIMTLYQQPTARAKLNGSLTDKNQTTEINKVRMLSIIHSICTFYRT